MSAVKFLTYALKGAVVTGAGSHMCGGLGKDFLKVGFGCWRGWEFIFVWMLSSYRAEANKLANCEKFITPDYSGSVCRSIWNCLHKTDSTGK